MRVGDIGLAARVVVRQPFDLQRQGIGRAVIARDALRLVSVDRVDGEDPVEDQP